MVDITAAGVCGIVSFWHSCYIWVWHLQGFEKGKMCALCGNVVVNFWYMFGYLCCG